VVKEAFVTFNFENMNEFRELLQKANHQLEQLVETLKQIEDFKFKVVQQRAAVATTAINKEKMCSIISNSFQYVARNFDTPVPQLSEHNSQPYVSYKERKLKVQFRKLRK